MNVKLFAGTASSELANKLADYYGQKLGALSIKRFSDGEIEANILESVRGAYTFFIQSTNAPADHLVELLLMIDAAKRASAGYITAVIPYFGYARQDRKDKPRVAIGAKLMANLLQAAGVNRIVTMDFHADQIQGFFDIPVDHLQSESIFIPYMEQMELKNAIFTSPDVGGIKRARTFANYFGKELVICDKYRKKANEVSAMTIIGDVTGKDVIMLDDMVDTGGTLIKAAETLLDNGANSVCAFATHGVLSGPAHQRIRNSRLSKLYITDTIPLKEHNEKITVLSAAKLFSRAVRNTHEHRSISALFVGRKDDTLFS